MIIPEKLKSNDEIRVLSPSSNFQRVGGMEGNRKAQERLECLGYKVTFSKKIHATDLIGSASIEERVEDLHAAFSDHNVKAILSTIGGFNSNELLPYIDYDLIRSNPKIICGYSDITALNNAITAKTGLVTYIGPHYSSFKMDELQDYQTEYFLKVCAGREEVQLAASDHYSDDLWFLPEEPRNLVENAWKVYTPGTAEGVSYVGNLNTFTLLQGTEYMPDLHNGILFVESAEENTSHDFARDLASLLQVAKNPKGLVIGRFPEETGMTEEILVSILDKHPVLKSIPVLYDVNFGHTQPIFTFPIGKKIKLDAGNLKIMI